MNFYKLLLCLTIVTVLIIINTQMKVFQRIFVSEMTPPVTCLRPISPTGETIPKRIHQIWNDEIVPAEFADNVKGLVRDNPPPDWEYYFWTKKSGLKFLQDKYPALYRRVTSGADDVMRADILRYAVIHEYGGLYFDLDTVSVKPLDEFADCHECSLVSEPGEHFFVLNTDFLLTNSALACRSKHQFFKRILSHIANLTLHCKYAFDCTGPIMLSNLYKTANNTVDLKIDLPEVQSSEIFQDVYDVKAQNALVRQKCQDYSKLQPYQVDICKKWKSRGMEKRSISQFAFTYHTWYHVYGRNMTILDQNNVLTLVPQVKIYGKNI